jgi:hypothetical protein
LELLHNLVGVKAMDDSQNWTENSSYCFNFTASDLRINTAVTVSLHFIAVLISLVTIVFIFAAKQHHAFVNRLVLYLMIASSLWSLTLMAEVIPVINETGPGVKVRTGWDATCAAIGFLSQLAETAKLLVVCWIVLYLLLVIVFKYNPSRPKHEVCGVLTVIIFPFFLDWIPFRWNWYGLSGLWCWIKLADGVCSHGSLWKGLGLMLAVEYIPVLLATIFTFVSFACIVIALCRRAYRTEIKWRWTSVYQKGLAEAAVLMIYPSIFAVIFIFRVIHRTYYVIQINKANPPNYTLWLAHSTALGIAGILVPLFYLLRPSNLKKFSFCRKFLLQRDVSAGTVYRSNSLVSTEAGDREMFNDSEQGASNQESSLLYKSILSSHKN